MSVVFIQANSTATPDGQSIENYFIPFLADVVAGDVLVLFCDFAVGGGSSSISISDTQFNTWFQRGAVSPHYGGAFTTVATVSGPCTVVVNQVGSGAFFSRIQAAVLEYSGLQSEQIPGFVFGGGWGKGTNSQRVTSGGGSSASIDGENSVWQPNTSYVGVGDADAGLGFFEVTDTSTPAHLQDVSVPGTSGSSAPAWNDSGGTTIDGTIEWGDTTLEAPPGALAFAMVGIAPFTEFPNPGAGWTLRTSALDFGGIAVYDQQGDWNAAYSATCTKSSDTYDLDLIMLPLYAPATPPPALQAWLVINEPSLGLTNQTRRMDGQASQQGSFQAMLRQRGTAVIALRIHANDTYAPTMGAQTFLYDQTPDGFTLVFSGTIDDIEEGWDGTSGERLYTLQCVSFEQCFDVIRVQPIAFEEQTCAAIITALYDALMAGAPVTLGTISTGATVPRLVISDFRSFASVLDQLATLSGFVWYVDPASKTLQFHLPNVTPSPFDLETSQMQWESMKWKQTRQDFRDRQILQISPDAFTHSAELFEGDSSAQLFTMLRPIETVTNAWTTKNTQNTADGTFTGQPNPGDTITTTFPSSGSGFNWSASSPYITGQIIIDPAGHVQRCTVAGTTGLTEPAWNDAGGPTGPDGTVFWQDDGISGGGGLSGATYEFVSALDNTLFGQVLIGASFAATAQNLCDAINAVQSLAGSTFSLPTWENPLVNCDTPVAGVFTIRNKNAGQGYIAALSESCANFTWSAPQTSGGITTFGTFVLAVAVEGTSNTANLYYTPGSAIVKLASVPNGGPSLPLPPGQFLQVEYTRLGGDCIQVEDTALVAARAAVEDGTGKYQQFTSDTGQTSNTAGLLEAQQALEAYATLPESFTFDTLVAGLTPGQFLTFTLEDIPPGIAALINSQEWVVQEVRGSLIAGIGSFLDTDHPWIPQGSAPGAGHYRYTVSVINASVIGSFLDFWEGLASGGSGGGGSSSGGAGMLAGAAGFPNGIAVKTADYTATAGDAGVLLSFEDTSPAVSHTLTLPATPPSQTWQIEVQNTGSVDLTIARNGKLIDGIAADIMLAAGAGIEIRTDGANYFTQRGSGSGGAFSAEPALTVLAGPMSGSPAVPAFRLQIVADNPFHAEVLTDGASNIIFAAGDVVMVVGVPN